MSSHITERIPTPDLPASTPRQAPARRTSPESPHAIVSAEGDFVTSPSSLKKAIQHASLPSHTLTEESHLNVFGSVESAVQQIERHQNKFRQRFAVHTEDAYMIGFIPSDARQASEALPISVENLTWNRRFQDQDIIAKITPFSGGVTREEIKSAIESCLQKLPPSASDVDKIVGLLNYTTDWEGFLPKVYDWEERVIQSLNEEKRRLKTRMPRAKVDVKTTVENSIKTKSESESIQSEIEYVCQAVTYAKVRLMYFKEQNGSLTKTERLARDQEIDTLVQRYQALFTNGKASGTLLEIKQIAADALHLRDNICCASGANRSVLLGHVYANSLDALGHAYINELKASSLKILNASKSVEVQAATARRRLRIELLKAQNSFFDMKTENGRTQFRDALLNVVGADLATGNPDIAHWALQLGRFSIMEDQSSRYFCGFADIRKSESRQSTEQMTEYIENVALDAKRSRIIDELSSTSLISPSKEVAKAKLKSARAPQPCDIVPPLPQELKQSVEETKKAERPPSPATVEPAEESIDFSNFTEVSYKKKLRFNMVSHALDQIADRNTHESAVQRCISHYATTFKIVHQAEQFAPSVRFGSFREAEPDDFRMNVEERINALREERSLILRPKDFEMLFVVHTTRRQQPVNIITVYPMSRERANEMCELNGVEPQF
jgi:ribosome-associated translation inhibitor RaiA